MKAAKQLRLFWISQLRSVLMTEGAFVVLLMFPFVIATQAGPVSYTYDSLNRLTKADYGNGFEVSYTYDAAGNRLTYSDIDTTPYVDTTVVAWGDNSYGETNVPAGLNNVVAVASGDRHSLALRADGTVVAWGSYFDQNDGWLPMAVPPGLSNVVALATSESRSLALRADGAVVAWGDDHLGRIDAPSDLTNVVAVAAGYVHSVALRTDGTVVAWGDNGFGQTNVPANLYNVVAVASGRYHSLALRANGTVVAWGDNASGQTNLPPGLNDVVAIAAGDSHNLALRADGTVIAWGNNSSGQTDVPAGLNNVVAIAAGAIGSLALRADGTVVSWGSTVAPLGLSNVVAIAAGWGGLALSGNLAPFLNGRLVAQTVVVGATATFTVNVTASQPCFYQWQVNGTNLPGATGKSLVLTNVTLNHTDIYSVAVSNSLGIVGSSASLTVVPLIIATQPQSQHVVLSGTARLAVECESVLPVTYQWRFKGTNLPGASGSSLVLTNVTLSQDGGYTVIVSNSAGSILSAKAALTVDQLAAWGTNDFLNNEFLNPPGGLSNVVAVAAGDSHSLALRSDGTVAAWGRNIFGQTNVPSGLSNVIAIAAGMTHSLALRTDGTVAAWGMHLYTDSAGDFLSVPVAVPEGLQNVVAVAAGGYHSLALRNDGTVVAWGANLQGQTNVPTSLSNVVAVAAGYAHSLAVQADGKVVQWGAAFQVNPLPSVPAGLKDIVAAACGGDYFDGYSLAQRADGTVVVWGGYHSGGEFFTMAPPSDLMNVMVVAGGGAHSLALRSDGSLVAWGSNHFGQTNLPALALPIGAIACGWSHSLAVPTLGPPFITSRLAHRQASVGGNVFFRVEASGAWPLHYQWQRNGVDLPNRTNAVLHFAGFTAGDAGSYSVIVSNHLGVATIPPANLSATFVDVQIALDNNLPWSSEISPKAWFAQTAQTHDGVDAAQSGAITHNQFSWLDSSVIGPGTLTFWWKVSSEPGYDYLEFYVDGVLQPNRISGEVDWQKQTNSLSGGPHALRWRYVKDISDTFGQDAGWLDEVQFTPPMVPPQFGGGLSASNGTLTTRLTGSPGTSVVVESSTNLITWTPIQTNTLPAEGVDLSMPMVTNQQQFFRARIRQP